MARPSENEVMLIVYALQRQFPTPNELEDFKRALCDYCTNTETCDATVLP